MDWEVSQWNTPTPSGCWPFVCASLSRSLASFALSSRALNKSMLTPACPPAHSLNWYRFIGRILGKALYDGILVDVAFAGFFLAKWLGKQSFLDDLASLDPDLYKGLIFLKHYQGNPEDLSLNFTIAVDGECVSLLSTVVEH